MAKICFIIAFSFLIAGHVALHAQTVKSQYKIGKKISLPGDDGWDYVTVDEPTGRLFISHGTQMQVVDSKTGKLLGTIPDTKGIHGIALATDLRKGFTSNGRDSSVTVFNLQTLLVITKIKVTGANPDAIVYDSFTHRVFTFNGRSNNSTVIDATTNQVIGTIVLDGKPEFSVSDGQGNLYVNIEDKSEVSRIDPASMKVKETWSLSPGEEPSGMALDKINHRLFCVCDNKLMVVVNSENGKVITSLPIGEGVDGCAFDPELKCVYSSNGEGTMTVILEENNNKFRVLENVATQKGARTIALDKKTHHIYLPTAEYLTTPPATTENPHPRPPIKPGTFVVLDVVPIGK
jgi:YVTN family beta-propeller protein